MMNLEDKIIAYLDGTLDETSRAELLHTLSVSPEKRKLLEEHIKLREIISLGHKPASVPLMTERKLAERIPVLMQELPYLAEKSNRIAPLVGVNSTSYFTLLGRQVSSFFTSRVGPAVAVGALLLIGGMTWYMSALNDGAAPVDSQTQIVQQQTGPQAPAESTQGTTNAASNLPEAGTTVNESPSNPTDRVANANRSRSSAHSSEEPRSIALREGVQDALKTPSEPGVKTPSTDVLRQETAHAVEPARTPDSEKTNEVGSSASDEQKSAIRDPEQQLPPLPMPSQERTVTGRFNIQADLSNGFMTVRPNQKTQSYEAGRAGRSFLGGGIGYEFDERFAIGVEVAQSVLSQQKEEYEVESLKSSQGPSGDLVSVNERITYSAGIVDVDAWWSQVSLRYTLNPGSLIKLEATGGAGAAFHEGLSPMVSLGLGGKYEITDDWALTLGVSARAAWMEGIPSGGPAEQAGPAKAVAVVSHRAEISDYVFSSSIAGRAGIRFTF